MESTKRNAHLEADLELALVPVLAVRLAVWVSTPMEEMPMVASDQAL